MQLGRENLCLSSWKSTISTALATCQEKGAQPALDMESKPQTNGNPDENLDERAVPDVAFEGVKLSMDSGNLLEESNPPAHPESAPNDNTGVQGGTGFYFASQSGRLETAATACQNALLSQEEDGRLLGVWLLTEIDHWDNEKERVAVVNEHSLLLVKFDFITSQMRNYRRILYSDLSALQTGNFVYPEKTLTQTRSGEGVRLFWGARELSVFEKWNPFSDTIPYTTLASHPLQACNTRQAHNYQVGPFLSTLQQAVASSRAERHPNLPPVTTRNEPIPCEIYVGLSSMVYNQSKLGFFRERGGVSF